MNLRVVSCALLSAVTLVIPLMEPADTTEPTYASSLVDALKTVVLDTSWQRVGVAADLRTKKCRKIYAEDGEHLALIYVQARDTFYAMEAACSHEGGPLDMGDIEDVGNGSWVVVCPWHHFEFDVATGFDASTVGL